MGQARMTTNVRAFRIIQAKLADYTLDEVALIAKKYREKQSAMTAFKLRRKREREQESDGAGTKS